MFVDEAVWSYFPGTYGWRSSCTQMSTRSHKSCLVSHLIVYLARQFFFAFVFFPFGPRAPRLKAAGAEQSFQKVRDAYEAGSKICDATEFHTFPRRFYPTTISIVSTTVR